MKESENTGIKLPIFARYGGKRGFIQHCLHMIKLISGGFSQYRHLDFSRVDRLVFVCKGNICRSPYAEASARANNRRLQIASFGLHAVPKQPANEQAVRIAGRRGIELNEHRTRRVTDLSIRRSDLLIAMEPAQAQALEAHVHACGAQITLLGLWAGDIMPSISDPYGHDDAIFEQCFDTIDTAIRALGTRIEMNGRR
jgi:protein-tyrosine phosphatase